MRVRALFVTVAMAIMGVALAVGGAGAATPSAPAPGTPGLGERPPASHLGAHSELQWTKQVAPDVKRYKFRYGPLLAGPGQNLILFGPMEIERPPGNGWAVRFKPDLEDPQGRVPPIEVVHTHHGLIVSTARNDITAPQLPQRFTAWAEEKTIGTLPRPYGYRIKSSDRWLMNYMLHNETPQTRELYITYEMDFIREDSKLGRKMKDVHPLWLDAKNGSAYPVFDIKRAWGGPDGRFTYPDDMRPYPYKKGKELHKFTIDKTGTLVATVGHVHPGGLYTDLRVTRGTKTVKIFRSRAKYFDPNGPVSWDMSMTYSPDDWRVLVKKGDVVSVHGTYDTTRLSAYEAMSLMVQYIAYGDTSGVDPFKHGVKTSGPLTHGHYAAADNYGGKRTGLPDPRKLPSGTNLNNETAIADFTYLPGDLSASNGLQNPTLMRPGEPLTFTNADEAGQIFHTITSCKPPCNKSTGISYPLPDGPVDFDSGELGYGPPDYSAATNKVTWTAPKNLKPGTYTYFCRVHPFMRGAFRVPGKPVEVPSASSLKIASRGVKAGKKGRAKVKLRCSGDGGGCAGKLELFRGSKGEAKSLGWTRYSLTAGSTRSVTVKLSKGAREMLREKGTMAVVGRAKGGGKTVTRNLTLKWTGGSGN